MRKNQDRAIEIVRKIIKLRQYFIRRRLAYLESELMKIEYETWEIK